LDRYTAAVLAEHLDRLADERTAFGDSYHDGGLVFCWPDGTHIYPDTITEKFNALVDRAGLSLITLHGIRHSYATIALRSGVHPKIVSSRLGHATVASRLTPTRRMYPTWIGRQPRTSVVYFSLALTRGRPGRIRHRFRHRYASHLNGWCVRTHVSPLTVLVRGLT
jgi:hypothetical protein